MMITAVVVATVGMVVATAVAVAATVVAMVVATVVATAATVVVATAVVVARCKVARSTMAGTDGVVATDDEKEEHGYTHTNTLGCIFTHIPHFKLIKKQEKKRNEEEKERLGSFPEQSNQTKQTTPHSES